MHLGYWFLNKWPWENCLPPLVLVSLPCKGKFWVRWFLKITPSSNVISSTNYFFVIIESRWVMRKLEWRKWVDAKSGPILWHWADLSSMGPCWKLFYSWKPCLLKAPSTYSPVVMNYNSLPPFQESGGGKASVSLKC